MATNGSPLGLILASSFADQIRNALLDDTFSGIHQLSWFDYSILAAYFGLLAILALYGLHRYETVRLYFKHRRTVPGVPATRFAELPRVTVQLPLYNERFVVERLLDAVARLEYPRHLLQIQVLDDSTDDTRTFSEELVSAYRARGFPIEYLHRTNRVGYKAGALQAGLETATGEIIAVFDADFVPTPDFLMRTVDFFADPSVGMVQTRWSYVNRDYSLLTEVQAMLLDAHFVLEHTARQGRGLFFNFNGTAGLLRRAMIEDAGGWEHDTLTEDSDLSYRGQLKGWKFVYVPSVDCPSELPVQTHAFQVQQSRWAKGLTQVALKLLPSILRADVPHRVKLEAFFHLTPNISYPLMVLVAALMLPAMIVRFYMGWFQMLVLDLPLVLATFGSIAVFYITAQRELYPRNWKRAVALLPFLMAAGVALTVINTRAVLEALLGVQSGFVRTPKYAITGNLKNKAEQARYRRRSGWLPYIELAIGTYFLGMAAYAIDTYNFLALPFLTLFVGGYYWAGLSTLFEEWQGRLQWERERQVRAETAR